MRAYKATIAATVSTRPAYSDEERELLKLLRKTVDPAEIESTFTDVKKAIRYARRIRGKRELTDQQVLDADFITTLKVFAEVRKTGTPYIKRATVLAAIIYTVLRPKRDAGLVERDTADEALVADYLNAIDDAAPVRQDRTVHPPFNARLGKEVGPLIRNTLQASEVNLGGQAEIYSGERDPQSEANRMADFRHMIMEIIQDSDVMLIRCAQRISDMRKLTDKLAEGSSPQLQAEIDHHATLIESIYIPLAIAYGFTSLANILEDQHLQMVDPDEYQQTWDTLINTARRAAPEKLRQFISNRASANAITVESIIKDVDSVVHERIQDDYEVEGNLKSVKSTHKKVATKGEAKSNHDRLRMRIIVDIALNEKTSLEEAWGLEQTACMKVHAALDIEARKLIPLEAEALKLPTLDLDAKALKLATEELEARIKSVKFGFLPEEIAFREHVKRVSKQRKAHEKDKTVVVEDPMEYKGNLKNYYVASDTEEERQKKPWNTGPKKNGYRAIHNVYMKNGEKFEVQIVGKRTHANNSFGTAGHLAYKVGDLQTVPDGNSGYTVSVFDMTNRIFRLSRPATAADFLAAIDPDVAFATTSFVVDRTLHLYDPTIGAPTTALNMALQPGDRIMYGIDYNLARNAEHRKAVINASQVPELTRRLMARDAELSRDPSLIASRRSLARTTRPPIYVRPVV